VQMSQYSADDAFLWCIPQGNQGTVCLFARYAGMDQHRLAAEVDEAKCWRPALCYLSEWAFRWCDYITRTTGRLTKNLRLIDLTGMTMRDTNAEIGRRDARASSYTQDFYPQLLQNLIFCHGPVWLTMIWRLIRPLLPQRLLEKVDFMNPTGNTSDRQRLRALLPAEVLPERFGGEYQPWPVQFELPKRR
jgi:hypothetical protein